MFPLPFDLLRPLMDVARTNGADAPASAERLVAGDPDEGPGALPEAGADASAPAAGAADRLPERSAG